MTIREAAESRRTVRKYTDRTIAKDIADQLAARIRENNQRYGLHMREYGGVPRRLQAVFCEGRAQLHRAGRQKHAGRRRNARLLRGGRHAVRADAWAEYLVGRRHVQPKRRGKERGRGEDETIAGIIAVGYGASQGAPHLSKKPEEVSRYHGAAPAWFTAGVEAALPRRRATDRRFSSRETAAGDPRYVRTENFQISTWAS